MRRSLIASLTALTLCGCDRPTEHQVEQGFAVYTGGDRVEVRIEDYGIASARGVWVIEGEDKIADPINGSRIVCHREEGGGRLGYCEDNRAWVTFVGGRGYLYNTSDLYDVTEWSPDRVVAVAKNDCRRVELRVSKAEQTVTQLVTAPPACSTPLEPVLAKPRLSRLVSGAELDSLRGIKD